MKDRVKAVRKENGLTQTEFAERLGVSRDVIATYESGRVVPGDSILKLISKEFSVSFAWLKTGDGPMEDPVVDDAVETKLLNTYQNMPDRLRVLVDVLVEMDPEWWKILDAAFAEIERRKRGGV